MIYYTKIVKKRRFLHFQSQVTSHREKYFQPIRSPVTYDFRRTLNVDYARHP